MNIGQSIHCPFCLNAACFELRLDRRQRPYGICNICGTRAFMRSQMALRGIQALWGPLTRAIVDGNTAAAREMIETEAVKAKEDLKRAYERQPELVAS